MTRLAARVIHALRRWGFCVDDIDVDVDDAVNELREAQGWPRRISREHPWRRQ